MRKPTNDKAADDLRGVSSKVAREMLGGIGSTAFYKLLKDGALESYTIGARRYVVVESIDRFIATRRAAEKKGGGFQSITRHKPWTRKRSVKRRRLREEVEA